MKIVITPRPFQKKGYYQIERLNNIGYDVVYNNLDRRFTKEEIINLIKDTDGIIVGNDILDKETLSHATKLKVIAKYGVGVDNIDVNYANEKGIKVLKALGANSISVAEMAVQLMLASSRNLYMLANNSKNNKEQRILGSELYNKVVGIIGIGAIGRHVAKICNGFGMKVLAYDVNVNGKLEDYINITELDNLIKNSDYITLHLPLLESTKNMINKEFIGKMKKDAKLINTARAGLVDNDALYNALKNKEISYVAEDVELAERSEELIKLENYLITPHAASFTNESDINTIEICVKNILSILERDK